MENCTKELLKKLKPVIADISCVIDVGASDGRWTKKLLTVYPQVNSIMVEANPLHEKSLSKLCSKNNNLKYEMCAAGDKEGTIYFDNSDLFGGLASHEKIDGIEVPVNTIDNIIKKHTLNGKDRNNFLLKLDTHGFEVPIFEGALETLKKTALIVVETYNFQLTKDSLKFWEMCAYLDKLGFSPIGISEIIYRKYDGALWQFDLMFIPKTSDVFKYNEFF